MILNKTEIPVWEKYTLITKVNDNHRRVTRQLQ